MVGEKLKQLLDLRGIKAAKLARETGIPKSTIYSIINRNNKDVANSTMEKIARYLGVPVDFFHDKVDDSSGAPLALDDFTFAMHNHSGNLTDKDKEILLSMAQQLADAHRKKDAIGDSE